MGRDLADHPIPLARALRYRLFDFAEWTAIPHHTLELLLPGFELLTVGSFILGAIEAYVVGWYIALLFGALYNYCRRWA